MVLVVLVLVVMVVVVSFFSSLSSNIPLYSRLSLWIFVLELGDLWDQRRMTPPLSEHARRDMKVLAYFSAPSILFWVEVIVLYVCHSTSLSSTPPHRHKCKQPWPLQYVHFEISSSLYIYSWINGLYYLAVHCLHDSNVLYLVLNYCLYNNILVLILSTTSNT